MKFKWGEAAAVGLLSALVVGAAISPASAAEHRYVNNVASHDQQWRGTYAKANISGGRSSASMGIGWSAIQTYLSQPGFSIYASAEGANPGYTFLNHARVHYYKSRCQWTSRGYPPLAGTAPLTCYYYD